MGAFKRIATETPQPTVQAPSAAAPRPRGQEQPRTRKGLRAVNGRSRGARVAPPASKGRVTPAPQQSRPSSLPFSAHRGMTASASLIDISTAEARTKFAKRRTTAAGWQDEAWSYVDSIGEIKYAFNLVANTLSRVRLYSGVVEDPALPPVRTDSEDRGGAAANAAVARLDSAFGGVPGLLRDAALNLQISGECNLVQVPANPFKKTPESWDIRSTDELQLTPEGKMVVVPTSDGDRDAGTELPKGAFAARIWRPHPRFSDEPDSSMRALLDACAELLLLNKTFRSTARSRLNAGILYLPDGLSVAASADVDTEPIEPTEEELADPDFEGDPGIGPSVLLDEADQSDTDEFEEALLEAMTTPIADEESASAVVPLIVRGPADLGEKIRLIQFERSFDPALADRSDRVLDRIMQGLDVPKEIVQGLANIKYSNAQVIDQQLYTSHIEPLALLICDALTTVYLRPSLRAAGISEEEIAKHVVWYDASDVTTRPNKADDAEQGWQNMAIKWETWRRTHGFTEDDAPSPEEVALRLMINSPSMTPELFEALLAVYAPDVMASVREASQVGNPAPLPPDVAAAMGNPADPAAPAPPPAEPEPTLPFEDTQAPPADSTAPIPAEDLV